MSGELYYMGLDIHKKSISFCVKDASGVIIKEGGIRANRESIHRFLDELDFPWIGAMEATMFTSWIYDVLTEQGHLVRVADSSRLKAISSSKKKSDRIDARMLADLLRCNLLPEIFMLDRQTRERRKMLRFRNQLVKQDVSMKNTISSLLMESGVEYERRRLHGKQYFSELLESNEDQPDTLRELLSLGRTQVELLGKCEARLVKRLLGDPLISERVERLRSIPGVGEITALTWVLEIGDPHRFSSAAKARSYCGLCSALKESAGKTQRGPLSKKRNWRIQTVLVEAAKLAPRWNPVLKKVYENELSRGDRNRATLAVARKLVAYMFSVDKSGKNFVIKEAA